MQTNKAARDRDDRSYQYYQDGTLKFMEDRLSAQGHRLFRYDNLSRVVETRTGIEAKGQAPADPPPSGLLYRQDYTFNEFGNLTARSGIWKPGSNCGDDGDFPFSHIYQNNRTVGDYYDADGRPTNKDGFSEVYDSAGRNVRHLPNDGEYELDRVYDGDGLEVKKIEKVWDFENNQWKEPTRKYYIRSTVKSGEIITEVAGDGKKSQTFVYAGSDLLARQTLSNDAVPVESVKWEHWDPAKISRRTTDKDRNSPSFSGVELDPLNKNALYFCLPQQPERGQYLLNSHDFPGAWAASAMQFCNFGGLFGPCDVVEGLGGNYFPFYGRNNDRFAQLPFEIGQRPLRNLDNPMAVAYDTFHELYSGAFLGMSGYNYAEGSSNNFVSSIYGYGMSDLHRLIGSSQKDGDRAGPAKVEAITGKKLRKALEKCVKEQFGLKGARVDIEKAAAGKSGTINLDYNSPGNPNTAVSIVTNALLSGQDIARKQTNRGGTSPYGWEAGLTIDKEPLTNYIASDLAHPILPGSLKGKSVVVPGASGELRTLLNDPYLAAQIHEFGNSFSAYRSGSSNYYGSSNPIDEDAGYALDECLVKRLRNR